ncbi:MAG: DUF3052 domain-containing protein [Acidimicrobiales bacterium]
MTPGYSGTPLAAKLGIRAGQRLELLGAPHEWSIADLPEDVVVTRRRSATPANVVVAFFQNATSLNQRITELSTAITTDGALWIAWPRKAAGHVSDLTDNVVRGAVLPLGLVDVKVAALDDDWSALKMVWRKELRAGRRSRDELI